MQSMLLIKVLYYNIGMINNNLKIQLQTLIGHQLFLRTILVLLIIKMLDPVNCGQINSLKLTKV